MYTSFAEDVTCCLCGKNTDDVVNLGKLITVGGITAHHFSWLHIHKLWLRKVFEMKLKIPKSSPNMQLFENSKKNWKSIDKSKFTSALDYHFIKKHLPDKSRNWKNLIRWSPNLASSVEIIRQWRFKGFGFGETIISARVNPDFFQTSNKRK